MLIRKFKPDDAGAISDVIRQTMRMTNSRDYPMETLEPLIEYFSPEKIIQLNEERICLVAEIEGRVIGTIALEDSELCTFFIHPDFQGKGIGARLLKEIERLARYYGLQRIDFGSSLTAVSFYEKMGYRKNGRDKEGTGGHQIGMEKLL